MWALARVWVRVCISAHLHAPVEQHGQGCWGHAGGQGSQGGQAHVQGLPQDAAPPPCCDGHEHLQVVGSSAVGEGVGGVPSRLSPDVQHLRESPPLLSSRAAHNTSLEG